MSASLDQIPSVSSSTASAAAVQDARSGESAEHLHTPDIINIYLAVLSNLGIHVRTSIYTIFGEGSVFCVN